MFLKILNIVCLNKQRRFKCSGSTQGLFLKVKTLGRMVLYTLILCAVLCTTCKAFCPTVILYLPIEVKHMLSVYLWDTVNVDVARCFPFFHCAVEKGHLLAVLFMKVKLAICIECSCLGTLSNVPHMYL